MHLAVRVMLEVIGPQRGVDHAHEGGQYPVFVQAGHAAQAALERALDGPDVQIPFALPRAQRVLQVLLHHQVVLLHGAGQGLKVAAQALLRPLSLKLRFLIAIRVKLRLEKLDQQPRQQRVPGQGLGHVIQGEGNARLQQIFAIGPQDLDLSPAQAGRQDQAIQTVAGGDSPQDIFESFLEPLAHLLQVQHAAAGVEHVEVLHPNHLSPVHGKRVRTLTDHFQAHVLQHGKHIRQGDRVALAKHLESNDARVFDPRPVQAQAQIIRPREPGDPLHIKAGHPG